MILLLLLAAPVDAGIGAFLQTGAAALTIINGGLELECWMSRCKQPDREGEPPPFSGKGNYWRSRRIDKKAALCTNRIKIEVPKTIKGRIPYVRQAGSKWIDGNQTWTVRLGRGRTNLTANSGASGSYKRIRYVRGTKNSTCRNAAYPDGAYPPACFPFGTHTDYWSDFGFAAFSNSIASLFGNFARREVRPVGGPEAPPDEKCTNEELSIPPAAEIEYDRSVNGGYGHPMCDDEYLGYESSTTIPCRTGRCAKARDQETIWSVYKDETVGFDEAEDADAPDEFFIFAHGTQNYQISFRDNGYLENMANDHERLIPQKGTETIQIKRVSHSVINRKNSYGYEYVRNVYPNHTDSIRFWEKIIGQAHHNTRWTNYDDFLSDEVGGAQFIEHPNRQRDHILHDTRFCRREEGNEIHRLARGLSGYTTRRVYEKCVDEDKIGVSDATVLYGNYPVPYSCEDAVERLSEHDLATSRDFCIQGAPDWPNGFNLNPEANEDAPTEAYSDYVGCPEDAPDWYFYVCLEDEEDADGNPDCETRPRSADHAIRWVARLDEPGPSSRQEPEQFADGSYTSYPFVIPMEEGEAAYPTEEDLVVEEYIPEHFQCYSAPVTWWERPEDRFNKNENTKQTCAFFDKYEDGYVIRSGAPYTDRNGFGNYSNTIYSATNIHGSIMPDDILRFSDINPDHILTANIFAEYPDDFAAACCGLGGGTLGTAAPTTPDEPPPPPPPSPPPCFDRLGTFSKTDLNLNSLQPERGCATLYNPTGTSFGYAGGTYVNATQPLYTWLCNPGAYRDEIDCNDDDIEAGRCEPALGPGATGLQVEECCACGGGFTDRTEPFTYAPTMSAPTSAPTTCADMFSMTVPFFHEKMYGPIDYKSLKVFNPDTGALLGYDAEVSLEYIPLGDLSRLPSPYADNQGACKNGDTLFYDTNCTELFPIAHPSLSNRLQPHENGATALLNNGIRFHGANATFKRSRQVFRNRPVFEVTVQTDLFNRHVIAYVNGRWVLSASAEELLEVSDALAFTAESDLCPETSTWVTKATMEHGLNLREHASFGQALQHSLMTDDFYVEWPIEFVVVTDEPTFTIPEACSDVLTVEASQIQNNLLWPGSVRGAIGTYHKTMQLRNGRPMWAHSNFTDHFNWHIYSVSDLGVSRWVIDEDDDAANGYGLGAYTYSDASCPEDLLRRRRQTTAWITMPTMYGNVRNNAEQAWTSLRVADVPTTTETTAASTAETTAETTAASTAEDDDDTLLYALAGGGAGLVLFGLYAFRARLFTSTTADFKSLYNLL